MKVLLAERKSLSGSAVHEGRTSFAETLQKATVIMLTCPLMDETRGMIDVAEFSLMGPETVVVNVSRGPVIAEEAFVKALKLEQIFGGATDVFVTEPATKANSALVREASRLPNLIMLPHVAWYCRSTVAKVRRIVQENVEAFWINKPQNLVIYKSESQLEA
jgi:glycerate dehydrogenase